MGAIISSRTSSSNSCVLTPFGMQFQKCVSIEKFSPRNSNASQKELDTLDKDRNRNYAFEAPSTWVMRLQIPQNVFDMRCPRVQSLVKFLI